MSYAMQHRKMEPVLKLARQLDIATNPDPQAIFEAGSAGFNVWCIPADKPAGWEGIEMDAGAFSKPCEFVGSVVWDWAGDVIVGLKLDTSAYVLGDQMPGQYIDSTHPDQRCRSIYNRAEDLAWLSEKVAWLFDQAGVSMPELKYEAAPAPVVCVPAHRHPAEDAHLEMAYEDRVGAGGWEGW